jgi:formylglycine-generating enzyme required for sulfatase activity
MADAPKGMAWIPRGEFRMGSNDFYMEERPVHEVGVDGFWMDEHPVTVAQFRRFVKSTGYVTWAERPPDFWIRQLAPPTSLPRVGAGSC